MIQVGSKAPDFTMEAVMPDGTFGEVRLSDYRGRWLLFFFYPLDFTFVCPTEITGYSKRIDDFRAAGADIVGASIDSKFSHLAWINHELGKIKYPLASDITKNVSREYGILLENAGIALRGAFLIDPEGILRWQLVNDLSVGRSVDETLRVLKALQTGENCPVDWHEGEKTLG